MKKNITNIILLFFISTYLLNCGWSIASNRLDLHWGYRYVRITCADSLNCIACGNYAWIWPFVNRTTDAGNTWEITMVDSSANDYLTTGQMRDAAYPDTNLAVVVCDSGKYWVSNNKAKTWTQYRFDTNKTINDISFINSKDGVIKNTAYSKNRILITHDGAINWDTLKVIVPDSLEITYGIDEVFMVSNDIIFVVGLRNDNDTAKNYVIRTTNRGATWECGGYFYHTYNNIRTALQISNIHFFDENFGFALSSPKVENYTYKDIIYKTTDGGKTWNTVLDTILPQPRCTQLFNLEFADRQYGIATGNYSKVWKTSDFGSSWILDTSLFTYDFDFFSNESVAYPSPNLIFIGEWVFGRIIKWVPDETDDVNIGEAKNNTSSIIKVYPNPTLGNIPINIEIELKEYSTISMCIYDILGKEQSVLFTQHLEKGKHYIQYTPDTRLLKGVYFIKMKINNREEIQKIVVQ